MENMTSVNDKNKNPHSKSWNLKRVWLIVIIMTSLGIVAFLPGSQVDGYMAAHNPAGSAPTFNQISPLISARPLLATNSILDTGRHNSLSKPGKLTSIVKDNVDDLQPIRILRGHDADITALAISPDSSRIASSSVRGEIRIWESKSGTLLHSIQAHDVVINSVAFSSGGNLLASGADDQTVKIWDVQKGQLIRTIDSRLAGRVLKVRFTPDGKYIAMAGHKCLVVLRDVESGIIFKSYHQRNCLPRLSGSVESWGIDFTEIGDEIILGVGQPECNCGSIQRWEVEVIATNNLIYGYSIPVKDLDLSPDGKNVAVAMIGTSFIRMIDSEAVYPIRDLRGHLFRVNSIQFSPDGQLLASVSNDQRIGLWDANNGQRLRLIHEHTDAVIDIKFSPDGSYLASASNDDQVILWGIDPQ